MEINEQITHPIFETRNFNGTETYTIENCDTEEDAALEFIKRLIHDNREERQVDVYVVDSLSGESKRVTVDIRIQLTVLKTLDTTLEADRAKYAAIDNVPY